MAAMTVAAGCLFAQNPADDPGGWTKAKWGMTQAQIVEAYSGQTRLRDYSAPKPHSVLEIAGISIGTGPPYKASFSFDKASRLSSVLIEPATGMSGTGSVASVAKSNLLTALTDKYGLPQADTPIPAHDDYGMHKITYKWTWIFPTTVISLNYVDYGSSMSTGVTGITYLSYRLRQTSDAL